MMSEMNAETGYAEMNLDDWLKRLKYEVNESAEGLLECEDTQWLWSPEILRARWFAGFGPEEYAEFILGAYVLI